MFDLNKVQIEFLQDTAQRKADVSDSDYFGEEYKSYISNSLLKLISPDEGGAPSKFLSGFKSEGKSPALELGTAVHQMILEKDKYFISEVQKPSGKVGPIIETYHDLVTLEKLEEDKAIYAACIAHDYYKDKLTAAKIEKVLESGAEYLEFLRAQVDNPGCIVLTQAMREKFQGAYDSVTKNSLIMDLLQPKSEDQLGLPLKVDVYNEDVMTMDFNATIVNDPDNDFFNDNITLSMKAKIDNWTIDYDNKILTLNDLKTTGKPINQFAGYTFENVNYNGEAYQTRVRGSFEEYHYYRQMAMYAFILKNYASKVYGFDETWKFKINMLVVETNAPFICHVFSVGNSWITKGYHEFISLLKRVAYHKINGFDKFIELDLTEITEI